MTTVHHFTSTLQGVFVANSAEEVNAAAAPLAEFRDDLDDGRRSLDDVAAESAAENVARLLLDLAPPQELPPPSAPTCGR